MSRPPMLAVIGAKNSGKTTLTVQLTAELHRRGHRVMTIKHGSHTFNIDPATTDTYRHYHEGMAERVAMVSPDKFALVARGTTMELTPEDVAERYMADADIIVCEGFKRSALPKVEVFRRAVHERPLYREGAAEATFYIAMVTDVDIAVPFPLFSFSDSDWLSRLATLVEDRVMELR